MFSPEPHDHDNDLGYCPRCGAEISPNLDGMGVCPTHGRVAADYDADVAEALRDRDGNGGRSGSHYNAIVMGA